MDFVISTVNWVEVIFLVWFYYVHGAAKRVEGFGSLQSGVGEVVNGEGVVWLLIYLSFNFVCILFSLCVEEIKMCVFVIYMFGWINMKFSI